MRPVSTAIAKEAHTRVCAGDEKRMNERPSDTVSEMANADILLFMLFKSSLSDLKLSTENDVLSTTKSKRDRNETFYDHGSLNASSFFLESQAILGATLAVRLRTCFFLVYSVHLWASLYRASP